MLDLSRNWSLHHYTNFVVLTLDVIDLFWCSVSGFLVKNKMCMGLLTIALCTTLALLIITYITAVSMVTSFSIYALKYKEVFNIQEWVLGSLVVVIFLVFLLHLSRFLFSFFWYALHQIKNQISLSVFVSNLRQVFVMNLRY